MRKLVILTTLLLFFFSATSVLALSPTPSSISASPTVSLTPTQPKPTPTPIVYELPYPGILPDNPLYPLKALRDRIISFLINDPLKKAEFNLLNANKRLNAGIFLIEKKKYSLAASTISKSNNYMHEAISKMNEAKDLGKDVSSFKTRLTTSLKKHQEVILSLEKVAAEDYSQDLKNELQRLVEFEKLVK